MPNLKPILVITAFTLVGALPTCLMAGDGAAIAKDKCAECHGKDGNSSDEKVPNIAGFSKDAIIDTLNAYKEGDRTGDKYTPENGSETDMGEITKDLSDEDIETLASYYASQKFKTQKQTVDAKLAKKGAKIHDKSCEKCHSDGGSNADDDAAILAGQWKAYLEKEFDKFSSGDRSMPKKMKKKFKKLSDKDKEALIHYYAGQN